MGQYSKVKPKSAKKRKPQHRGSTILKILVWVLAGILLALIAFRLFLMPGILYDLQNSEDTQPTQNSQTDETPGNGTTVPDENTEPQQDTQPQDSEVPTEPGQTEPTPGETTAPEETTAPTEPEQTEPAPSETTVPGTPDGTTPPSQSQQSVVSLPAMLDGGLKLENLFQFSGINPDAGNQEGSDIATILLKNTSDTYLARADLTITLADGKKLTFTITNLPAGQSAMAFSKENASIGASATCRTVNCTTSFVPGLNPIPAKISVSTDGTTVTLTNNSDQALSNLVVYCRCPLGEEYFGGIAYQYTIKNIPPRGTTTVDAVDCILGMAEVVCVEIDKE